MQLLNKLRWTEIPPSTQAIQAVPSHLQKSTIFTLTFMIIMNLQVRTAATIFSRGH